MGFLNINPPFARVTLSQISITPIEASPWGGHHYGPNAIDCDDALNMTTFRLPVRVYYEDTDAGGVVYYANYLRFMERARSEWLDAMGVGITWLSQEAGLQFVVSEATLKYHQPAVLGDHLEVSVGEVKPGGASLTLSQEVHRGGDLLCSGAFRLATVDSCSLRPKRLPRELAELLETVVR